MLSLLVLLRDLKMHLILVELVYHAKAITGVLQVLRLLGDILR